MSPQPSQRTVSSAGKPVAFSNLGLVIFDFDGVVADSETLSLATLRAALARFGIAQSGDEVRAHFLGKSLGSICRYVAEHSPLGASEGFAEVWQTDLFNAFRSSLKPVPSILGLLDHLDHAGLPYCIASSSTFERLEVALTAMDLKDRFRHVFSAEQVARGKPAPDLFLLAAKTLNVPPEACLVVEDSPYGIRAAASAGMGAVGFVGGQHLVGITEDHGRLLREEGAQHVVHSHKALIEMGIARPRGDT